LFLLQKHDLATVRPNLQQDDDVILTTGFSTCLFFKRTHPPV
jgi:hypothetical protein